MTPDEVVTNLEANIEHHNCRNDDQSSCAYCQNTISAISLIQDYQKLRERVSVEKIDKIIDEIMPCSCISAYKDRGLTAPDCANHNYKEDLSEQIVTYLQQPTEH